MPDTEVLSKKTIEDYHKSAGEIVPEEKAPNGEDKKDEAKPPIEIPSFIEKKEEAPEVKAEEGEKKEKKPKKDEDPHAENHRKALQEARAELREFRKQAAAELQARDARHAQLASKLEAFVKAASPAPTKESDPVAYLESQIAEVKKKNEELESFKTHHETVQRTTTQQEQFRQAVISAAAPFIEQTKDYQEAYKYITDMKREEMLIAGVPEDQVGRNMVAWESSFAAGALRARKSPSEQLYTLAQKLGYKLKTEKKPSEADQKLKSVKEGQEAAKTITTGGVDTELSLSALEQMSDEQIRQLAKDPKKWAKLVGAP